MADATIKPDSGNDLVLSNDDGSAKIEVNEGGDVEITPSTSLKVTLGSDSGDDFAVDTNKLVVEGDTGNVGIGQATPTNKVEIVHSNDGGDVGVKIENSAGSGSTDETVSIKAGHAGTVGGKIVFARHGNYGSTGDKSSTIEFYTADDNADGKRMTVEKGGDVTIETGNLIIGTAGKGIDFHNYGSGSPASNLLDDYEEGSFSITHGSIYGTTGYYTKIGNTVFIRGEIKSGVISSNSDFTFDLPFTSSRQAGGIATGISDPMKRFYLTVANSATTCRVEVVDGAANDNFWYFSLQYETSA